MGDGGTGTRRRGDPCRSSLHAHECDGDEVGADPRRQRHRVSRWDRQLHHRERALLRGVRQALHERARDHLRRVPRHRGPRRALLRLGSRQGPVRHLELAVQGDGDAQLGRGQRAGLQRARRASGPGRARWRPVARRASGRGRHAAASELRLPTGEEALPALHPGARRRHVRLQRRGLPAGCGEPHAELRPRANERVLLRRRLDAAHRRRAVHPHGRDHPAAAREHGPAGRRHPRAPRPRVDSGLDGHPDALQHPPGVSADAAHREVPRLRALHAGEHRADGVLGSLQVVLGEPDEGVLRRSRERGERLALRAAAADRRRQLCVLDGPSDARRQGEGLHPRG